MVKKERILSLIVVILMVVAAAITVNKTIFGHQIDKSGKIDTRNVQTDSIITVTDSGTVIVHAGALPGNINGYNGPVPLDIYVINGKISEVKALPNIETPSFFKRASKILDSWTGKTIEEATEMKVDGISGATYSSAAIINNVNVGLAYYEGTDIHRSSSTPLKVWFALAVTLAACILPLFVRNKIYHNIQLIANIIVLGFWSGMFLDYALILKYMSDGFTFPLGLTAIAMLIAAFVYPLFGHPQYYCTHICPLGSAQQIAGQLCSYKIKLSKKVLKGLDWFRKILWAVLMLSLWADCLTQWIDYELFQAFQFKSAPFGIIIVAIVFIALSAVISRPYCRFVCPTGSLFKRAENIG